ncbi:MAG: HAD-IA family hydrolase [Acidimicrobiales bacterium]|nr:HAD-IA family hydrolase [Acidimicrobiales bacterium]
MLAGIVFDFDGLIVDTEWPEYRSIAEHFEHHGLEFPPERWVHVIGSSWDVDWIGQLESALDRELDRVALTESRRLRARALRDPLIVLDGIAALIETAVEAGVPLAVASSSPRSWVEPHLEDLGLRHHFPVVRCRDDVVEAKPSPELYLAACAGLGIDPGRSVAIEDSANGVTAANAAGMVSVAIPNRLTRFLDLSHAALVVESAAALDLVRLRTLVAGG